MHVAQDLFEKRNDFFLTPSSTTRGALVLCFLVGVLSLAAGVAVVEPARIWGSFLLSLFFFFSISLGGVAFSAMQDVIGAVWGRPIKRIHEGFGAFLPVAAFLFFGFIACMSMNLFGANELFPWMRDPAMIAHYHGKSIWLTKNFMLIRDAGAVLVILMLATWQMRLTTRRDKAFIEGHKDEAKRLGLVARDTLRYWSAPVLVVYALCYSLLAFDMLMSLAPTWFSTLWAGWLFGIMMQTLMATILLFMFALKQTSVGHIYKQQQFHDVGKLMHGFTIFFAYTTYAHVLTIWYGNMPEETEYFIHRIHGPWVYFICILPFLSFVLPFFSLIFKAAKWTSFVTIPLAVSILVAQWMLYVLIVLPQVGDGKTWDAPWLDFGVLLGFIGLFLLSFFAFSKRNPLLGLADPLLSEALAEEH